MSTFARSADVLFRDLTWSAVGITVALVAVIAVLAARTPRGSRPVRRSEREGAAPQVVVILAMTALVVGFFHRGFAQYLERSALPIGGTEIRVLARGGTWQFVHANGYEENGEVHVPVGSPVALALASEDGIHSFRVPELRVQQEVVPGELRHTWFEATQETGSHPLDVLDYATSMRFQRAEFRGGYGPTPAARLHIVSRATYEALLRDGPPMPTECVAAADPEICWGRALRASAGCAGCHSDSPGVDTPAPSWATLFGRRRTFADGSTIVGDEAYIEQSIRDPGARIVRGYESIQMPAPRFSDRQVEAVVAYIRSLAH